MLNPRAPSVEISIHGNEYTIHQSPSLLSSHRAGGTTGAGKYGLRYGVHTARMICTSSFMICPRNPQRPQTQARTSPQVFYPSPKCPDQARGSRRRILESFYPLFVCASALGGGNVSFDSDPDTITLCFSRFSPPNTRSNCHLLSYPLAFPLFIPRDTLATSRLSTKSPPAFMFTAINNHPSRN